MEKTATLMTVSQFCEATGICRSTWQKMKRRGETPPIVNIGGAQRIRPEAAKAWLLEREERAVADAAHRASEGPDPIVA